MCSHKGGHCYLRMKMGMFLGGSWKNSKTPVERVEGGVERVEGSVERVMVVWRGWRVVWRGVEGSVERGGG